jgi:nucleoside-diphosphate-sugar epimerase
MESASIVKRVLVTGSQGYIGTNLCEKLTSDGKFDFEIRGIDSGFFADTRLVGKIDSYQTFRKDIREIETSDLEGIHSVVHLAALSNDPLGEINPLLTDSINFKAAVRLATISKECGVKRFIFLSTQSVYGISTSEVPVDEEGPKIPQTQYAISKLKAEREILELSSSNFRAIALRPATVFGFSPRFRSDIVFNNLLSSAFLTNEVIVLSDGKPWRPVLHVDDLTNIIIWLLTEDGESVNGIPINVGLPNVNYMVKDIASIAQQCWPTASLKITGESTRDERSYKVDFSRMESLIPRDLIPKIELYKGGMQMINDWKLSGYSEQDFRGEKTIRLARLKNLMKDKLVDSELRYS